MSQATAGPGFALQKGDGGSPENFTTIAEVRDISGPEVKTDLHEVTNQSSPGGFEELIPTIRRSGEVTFPVNFIPANPTHNATTGLWADTVNKTQRNFRLYLNNAANNYIAFAGYIVAMKMAAPVAGVLTGDITIKPVGQVTLN